MPADSRSNADAALAGATVVIRNPAAGGGAAAPSSLVDALGRRGGHVVERITTAVGSAAQFAAEAATAGAGLVVVHGGDGTVHEVVNGLVELPRAARPPLAVVPAGTGNDYARALGAPADVAGAAAMIERRATRAVGVGHVSGLAAGACYFAMGAGFGMMSAAVAELTRSRLLRGRAAYFLAGLKALLGFSSPELAIRFDANAVSGRYISVHVGLAPTTGGGYCLTPGAALDADRFELSLIGDRPRLLALLQWPWLSRGRRFAGVTQVRSREVAVEGPAGLELHLDGELHHAPDGRVRLTLVPDALDVLVG